MRFVNFQVMRTANIVYIWKCRRHPPDQEYQVETGRRLGGPAINGSDLSDVESASNRHVLNKMADAYG
jgi:hypothetical protein